MCRHLVCVALISADKSIQTNFVVRLVIQPKVAVCLDRVISYSRLYKTDSVFLSFHYHSGKLKMSLPTEDVLLYSIIAFIVIENSIEIYLSRRQVSQILYKFGVKTHIREQLCQRKHTVTHNLDKKKSKTSIKFKHKFLIILFIIQRQYFAFVTKFIIFSFIF